MILVGIDPSYTRTGLTILNTELREITSIKVENQIGEKDYVNLYNKANEQSYKVLRSLKSKPDFIISECPFAQAQFSSGLFALDSLLFYKLTQRCPNTIDVLHPSYLKYIHKNAKYKKSDSVSLAKNLLEVFTKSGYTFKVEGRWSNDECESFIFLVRLFIKLEVDDVLISELVKVNDRLKDKKEVRLFSLEEE